MVQLADGSKGLGAGDAVGPYQILAFIGRGGFGEVYQALDPRLERKVAVKVLRPELAEDFERLRRFEQETRAVARLNHPNIVHVFDTGVHDGMPYLAMEWIDGPSLRALMGGKPVPWRRATELAVQIAAGLGAAHDAAIVHRDLKPENVLIGQDGRVRIVDFGLAKRFQQVSFDSQALTLASLEPSVSEAGALVGTLAYMAPEQLDGRTVDGRADLFALGVILWEMITGSAPFAGETTVDLMHAILREDLPDLPAALALPPLLERVLRRCLEKDPAGRFRSARDLGFSLEATLGPAAPAVPAPGARRRSRRILGAAAALVLAAGAGAALGLLLRPAPPLPFFRQITFRDGTIHSARFQKGGQGVVFSAEWDGGVREVFAANLARVESRPLGFKGMDVCTVLPGGEFTVLERRSGADPAGVLARAALTGGAAKELVADVLEADSAADGSATAVVRRQGGRERIEFPPGETLYETGGRIGSLRVGPAGGRVAFLEHPPGPGFQGGSLAVLDRQRRLTVLTDGWQSLEGLAWRSPDEIWFTGSRRGVSQWLYSVTTAGQLKLRARAPGRLVLHDLAGDGRVLAGFGVHRATLHGLLPGASGERDLSWLDFSVPAQLSRDGSRLLFSEIGDAGGLSGLAFVRGTDGAPPVRLGEGTALGLSADGARAVLFVRKEPAHLELVPVGAGKPTELPSQGLDGFQWADFLPGGRALVMVACEPGKGPRLYVQDLASGAVRPLAPEGVTAGAGALSPDGAWILGLKGASPVLVPTAGGPPKPLPQALEGRIPLGWSRDGRSIFLRDTWRLPVRLSRFDPATGALSFWKDLAPSDPAGITGIGPIVLADDGRVMVYTAYRQFSDLFIIRPKASAAP